MGKPCTFFRWICSALAVTSTVSAAQEASALCGATLSFHTYHILQPLQISVLIIYNSYLERKLYRMARIVMMLDTFEVIVLLESLAAAYIRSGFEHKGI